MTAGRRELFDAVRALAHDGHVPAPGESAYAAAPNRGAVPERAVVLLSGTVCRGGGPGMRRSAARVLLVAAATGYQVRSFNAAAERLGVLLVLATDRCHRLDDPWRDRAVPIRFHDEDGAVGAIVDAACRRTVRCGARRRGSPGADRSPCGARPRAPRQPARRGARCREQGEDPHAHAVGRAAHTVVPIDPIGCRQRGAAAAGGLSLRRQAARNGGEPRSDTGRHGGRARGRGRTGAPDTRDAGGSRPPRSGQRFDWR